MLLAFFSDVESGLEDEFQGFLRGGAVEGFFAFGQFFVGDEAGMQFLRIVALRAVAPALFHSAFCPYFMHIPRHCLDQRGKFRRQLYVLCSQRTRFICFIHLLLVFTLLTRAAIIFYHCMFGIRLIPYVDFKADIHHITIIRFISLLNLFPSNNAAMAHTDFIFLAGCTY